MTGALGKLFPAFLFGLLYALTTPLRHPYFNAPMFFVSLGVVVLTLSWVLSNKKIGVMQLLLASLYGYLGSVIAYAITWFFQGQEGITAYARSFGRAELLSNLSLMPVFSYCFILMPLSLGLAFALTRAQHKRRSANT